MRTLSRKVPSVQKILNQISNEDREALANLIVNIIQKHKIEQETKEYQILLELQAFLLIEDFELPLEFSRSYFINYVKSVIHHYYNLDKKRFWKLSGQIYQEK